MIEQNVEAVFVNEITSALSSLEGVKVEIIGARQPAASGYVKGERDHSAGVVISVNLGFRSHDNFSLPTINISGIVSVSTRVELNADGANHEAVMEKLATLFSDYHSEVEAFSEKFSSAEFYATELRLDGGTGKSYDSDNAAWSESFNFTIRGAIK